MYMPSYDAIPETRSTFIVVRFYLVSLESMTILDLNLTRLQYTLVLLVQPTRVFIHSWMFVLFWPVDACHG